jgi:lactate dehydrogenase-like 2-hydroxyacid dehydrogenase
MSIRRFLSRGTLARTTMSSSESTKPRLAILDDYQEAAFKHADWSRVQALTQVRVFTSAFSNEPADRAKLIEELKPFEIICTMRERTRFPAEVLSQLPNLKLLTTTAMGNAAIDVAAARDAGIVVSGTAYNPGGTNEHKCVLIASLSRSKFSCT